MVTHAGTEINLTQTKEGFTRMGVGSKAPDFSLKDKNGTVHQLSRIKSKYTFIYFYPKDSTPGCTIEAHQFNQHLTEFEKEGVQVIGISGGDEKSKTKFCDKNRLNLLLLSDRDFSISKEYGVYGEKKIMGKKFQGIYRSSYLLDTGKKVLKVYEKVNPFTHAVEVLKDVKKI